MVEYGKPTIESLQGQIEELRRAVRDLQRANRVLGAIPQGETIEVLDPADGSTLVRMGDTTYGVGVEFMDDAGIVVARFGTTSGGVPGVEIGDAPGTEQPYMAITQEGQYWPYVAHPFAGFLGALSSPITSATFTTTHRCAVELVTFAQVKVRITASCDGATTGEVRVHCNGNTTSAVALPAGVFTDVEYNWDVSSFVDVNTGPWTFDVQARRTGGAGNVNVYPPTELAMGFMDGTATGL